MGTCPQVMPPQGWNVNILNSATLFVFKFLFKIWVFINYVDFTFKSQWVTEYSRRKKNLFFGKQVGDLGYCYFLHLVNCTVSVENTAKLTLRIQQLPNF